MNLSGIKCPDSCKDKQCLDHKISSNLKKFFYSPYFLASHRLNMTIRDACMSEQRVFHVKPEQELENIVNVVKKLIDHD